MIFLIVIVAFLAAGIIPTLLITKSYDKKPINPYLPAFVLWLLGILNYLYSKITSHLQDTGKSTEAEVPWKAGLKTPGNFQPIPQQEFYLNTKDHISTKKGTARSIEYRKAPHSVKRQG